MLHCPRLSDYGRTIWTASSLVAFLAAVLVAGILLIALPSESPAAVPSPYQPNIIYGGRLVALTIDPTDASRLIAASESGGLFRTSDGGGHWTHIDSLPQHRMSDVKISPHNKNHIIATTHGDTHVENEGGIWRSIDGGVTWTRPRTSEPQGMPCSGTDRFNGGGISFSPDDASIYVGTSCGLAISRNSGRTWRHIRTDPGSPPDGGAVGSVVAHGTGLVDIYGIPGFQRSTNRAGTFGPPSRQIPLNDSIGAQALAVSPFNDNVLFVAAGLRDQLYESDDGGNTWTQLSTPVGTSQRVPIVATIPLANLPFVGPAYVLYFGGINLARQVCVSTGSQLDCSSAREAWDGVDIDHADVNGIISVQAGICPDVLAATDGGAHRSQDCGASFRLTGGGTGGLNALQIYEVTGQVHPDHTDLYFGTQDNALWASPDDGLTWPNRVESEGFYLQMAHRTDSHNGQTITGQACFTCNNFQTEAHFVNPKPWSDPPGAAIVSAPVFIDAGVYVEWAQIGTNKFQLYITETTGTVWTPIEGTMIETPGVFGLPLVAGPSGQPTLYQAVQRPNGSNGLIRITGVRSNLATTISVDTQIVDLAFFCNAPHTFVCKAAVGVNPNDPMHVIVADVGAQAMKSSADGGATWSVDTALSRAVTANGSLLFFEPSFISAGQVHSIAFDPGNSNLILVGTEAAGIIRSENGGRTWAQVPNSIQIPAINSFFFDEIRGLVTISSYGRGLWRMSTRSGSLVAQAVQPDVSELHPSATVVKQDLLLVSEGDYDSGTISKMTSKYDANSLNSCRSYCSNSGYQEHTCLQLDGATSNGRTLTGWYCCREIALPDRSIIPQETVQRKSGIPASCILPQTR
jgi:photosystem II stability/assembly factor-like uncharacterized protein